MPTNVIFPKMAESVVEGTITRWLKKPGDTVKKDEPLLEISTDKVDTDLPAPASGILVKVLFPEGATVQNNTVIAVIDESAAPGTVQQTPQTPTPQTETKKEPVTAEVKQATKDDTKTEERDGGRYVSPVVARIAQEKGIDISKVKGTGYGGRVTKQDLEKYIEEMKRTAEQTVQKFEAQATQPQPKVEVVQPVQTVKTEGVPVYPIVLTGPHEVVTMNNMRKKIAEHMVASRRISPHVATVWEADVSRICEIREKEKAYYERVYGFPLTYTPFFAYAAVQALQEFPYVNSSVDGDRIYLKYYVNVGIAVALADGLIVPVVKNAHEKSFLGLAKSINDVSARARTKSLTLDDLSGGTFTITNPGVFGGLYGIPIINQPQVAIMGVGGIHKRPVVVNDAIAIRQMVYMSLSFDHRVIDGALADQFMGRVKQILENWNTPVK